MTVFVVYYFAFRLVVDERAMELILKEHWSSMESLCLVHELIGLHWQHRTLTSQIDEESSLDLFLPPSCFSIFLEFQWLNLWNSIPYRTFFSRFNRNLRCTFQVFYSVVSMVIVTIQQLHLQDALTPIQHPEENEINLIQRSPTRINWLSSKSLIWQLIWVNWNRISWTEVCRRYTLNW